MKEQAYNKDNDQDQDQHYKSLTSMQSQGTQSQGVNDLASGEIVSLKILSRTWNLGHSTKKSRSSIYLRCNRLEREQDSFIFVDERSRSRTVDEKQRSRSRSQPHQIELLLYCFMLRLDEYPFRGNMQESAIILLTFAEYFTLTCNIPYFQ
ncbi:hypothetical protein Tco_0282273, partial [Tanacetum coccineum]